MNLKKRKDYDDRVFVIDYDYIDINATKFI